MKTLMNAKYYGYCRTMNSYHRPNTTIKSIFQANPAAAFLTALSVTCPQSHRLVNNLFSLQVRKLLLESRGWPTCAEQAVRERNVTLASLLWQVNIPYAI